MKRVLFRIVPAVALCFATGSGRAAAVELTGGAKEAAEELWRRGVCMLSSVIEPAKRASEVPVGLKDVPVVWGRPLSMSNEIGCFTQGERHIWLATDSALFEVEVSHATRMTVRKYTPADGLPDAPIDALHYDGRFLWLIQRDGLSALDLRSGKFVTEGMPKFSHAGIVSDGQRAWIIAENGTFIYSHKSASWEVLPAIPTGGEIASRLARGIWAGRRRETLRGLLGEPVLLEGDIYIPSAGSLYRFEGTSREWSRISDDAWKVAHTDGRIFFIGAFGVGEYDPATGQTVRYEVGEAIPDGRPQFLVATEKNVWVALDAQGLSESYGEGKGGVARFDLKKKEWSAYREINGEKADQVTLLQRAGAGLWCATQNYTEVATIVAHPGMAHCKRQRPKVEGLSLHRYIPERDQWQTVSLPIPEGEPRMILGQRGTYNQEMMVPRLVRAIVPGRDVILCQCDLYPRQYYSGYYPTTGICAERDTGNGGWRGSFTNHASQLDLQGEQPSVLLISGSHGHRIVLAAGHNEVLGLFRHRSGTIWAVNEGCLAWFDEAERKWHRVVEPPYRFYWRATAAAADDENLWIGSDCGLISRINKRSHEAEVQICLPRREVTQLAFDDAGKLWVKTARSQCRRLPVQMESVSKGPAAEIVTFDGEKWEAAEREPAGLFDGESDWAFEKKRNFLLRRTSENPSGERAFFVAGIFRPKFLLEDRRERCLWVSTYCGLVKLPLEKHLRGEL